jgi:5-methylcytosine-specific restriction protein B
MTIPKTPKLTLPLLQLLKDGNEHSMDEAEKTLALDFGLTPEERSELQKSGKTETKFRYQLAWSCTHLLWAELIERTRTAHIKITSEGSDFLKENPPELTENYLTNRFPAFARRRRRGNDDLLQLSKLTDFIKTTMRMDYNYQPVVILSLLKCPNFTSTTKLVVDQIAQYNSYRKDYSQSLKEAIDDTMGPSGHGFVKFVNDDTIRLMLEPVSEQEKHNLINLCYEKIAEWDSRNIVSELGKKERISDDSQVFLLQVGEKGSQEILENKYLYERWADFESNKRDRVYGEVKPEDLLLVYFTNNSLIHSKMVKMIYVVSDVSDDHVELKLRPVKQLSGVHLDTVRKNRDNGVLGEKFNLVGQSGNITKISRQDYLDILTLDYKSKLSIDENTFSTAESIVKKVIEEYDLGQATTLSSFLKDENIEGYKGKILARARKIFKNDDDEDIIEKLKEASSQKVVDNLFRFRGGPEESEARMLYGLQRGSSEEQELEQQLKLFFRTKNEIEFGTRWDSLVSTITSIKNKYVYPDFLFLSYLAFLQNPQLHIPFSPRRADELFNLFGISEKISHNKDGKRWQIYYTLLELANELRLKLADHRDLDLIDVQGYMWTLASALEKGIKPEDKLEDVSNSMEPTESEGICDDLKEKGYFELLKTEKQIIFYGPPGTGKTFTAKNLAKCFTQTKEDGTIDEFYERLIDELKMISKTAGYSFEKKGTSSQKMFVMKKGDQEIRVEFHKAVKGDYFMVNAGTKFLTENPEAKNFLIITNESVESFLCLPYDVEQEYSEFVSEGDGTGGWDPSGKGKHSVHNLKINREEAHFEPKKGETGQKDVSEYLNTWKHLSEDNNFESTNMARNVYHVTFHPSYSYEDFIEGFRPNVKEGSSTPYILEKGIFMRACDFARVDKNRKIVLMVDEINRGNIPKIFGELISLIENSYRGQENVLKLAYSKDDFFVPENLYIIGTMNTADKSLVQVDEALRRRFAFEELMPNPNLLDDRPSKKYKEIMIKLNEKIVGTQERMKQFRDRQIGHTYFWNLKNNEDLRFMIRYKLIPLLQDYFYDDYGEIRKILGNKIIAPDDRPGEILDKNNGDTLFEELTTFLSKKQTDTLTDNTSETADTGETPEEEN